MTAADLLPLLLEPLLDDFCYWLTKSNDLLTREQLDFLTEDEQQGLLTRVQEAQQAVETSNLLFKAMDKQVAIDPVVVMNWHRLLMECQAVGMQYRQKGKPEVL